MHFSDIPAIRSRSFPPADAAATLDAVPYRIAAMVLAAGRSRRMGFLNKLLIEIDGKPMVRHAVDVAFAAGLDPVIVITGHERDKVMATFAGLPVVPVYNVNYREGLSTSLKAGLAALPPAVDGVLICPADMPLVSVTDIQRLVAAFAPRQGRAIVVPTRNGKRGNPVLWAGQLFAEIGAIAGDVGARQLIGANFELVAEVAMAGDGVLIDIDTPQALARLAGTAQADV